ncbi:MAG: hypothetical protein O2905_01170 [Proteobacteria bacterium]|nr:hypothetical protein [Pseudomonadota bacterium]MDA1131821.1 hypothetical protein [Pseudomonadota bacterium]
MSPEKGSAAGNDLPEWSTAITAARQQQYGDASGADSGLFGGAANPTILCTDCLLTLRKARIRLDQTIQVSQRLAQHRPVAIDEPLLVRGQGRTEASPKGADRTTAAFQFLDRDGEIVVKAETVTLAANPDALRTRELAASDPSGLRLRSRKLLTPTHVQSYSAETATRIHFDPAYAVRYGLRAPVAPGLFAVAWSMDMLPEIEAVESFSLLANFGAPLFWDDGVDILGGDAADGRMDLRFVSSAGAVVATVALSRGV